MWRGNIQVGGRSGVEERETEVLYLQGNESDSNLLIQDSIRILEEGGMGESEICIRRLRYLVQMVKDIMKTL
ncbi:hypothetical protein QJS10_CPA06g02089 [Acorus calamus]|uniref:Uncharacterized protein n=1 Tax=Acorus calamus TaxID=4465 RepID=A0AAV9ENT2_ACOCL|nr:hypothetical protein QJS10_CPA06g02089 [Acorus calamus]